MLRSKDLASPAGSKTRPRFLRRLFRSGPGTLQRVRVPEKARSLLRDVKRFTPHPAYRALFRRLVRFHDVSTYSATPFVHDAIPVPLSLGRRNPRSPAGNRSSRFPGRARPAGRIKARGGFRARAADPLRLNPGESGATLRWAEYSRTGLPFRILQSRVSFRVLQWPTSPAGYFFFAGAFFAATFFFAGAFFAAGFFAAFFAAAFFTAIGSSS